MPSEKSRFEINGTSYLLHDANAVKFDRTQSLTTAQKQQARGNIGAVSQDDIANNLTTTEAGKVLDARQGKALNDKINATQSDITIIIEGNQTTHTGGVAVGQYVIVRNSTISSITDGLYRATQAIPANTAIDSTYLEAVDGGLGSEVTSLKNKITQSVHIPASAFALSTVGASKVRSVNISSYVPANATIVGAITYGANGGYTETSFFSNILRAQVFLNGVNKTEDEGFTVEGCVFYKQ